MYVFRLEKKLENFWLTIKLMFTLAFNVLLVEIYTCISKSIIHYEDSLSKSENSCWASFSRQLFCMLSLLFSVTNVSIAQTDK